MLTTLITIIEWYCVISAISITAFLTWGRARARKIEQDDLASTDSFDLAVPQSNPSSDTLGDQGYLVRRRRDPHQMMRPEPVVRREVASGEPAARRAG
jgi:hypothetical protein